VGTINSNLLRSAPSPQGPRWPRDSLHRLRPIPAEWTTCNDATGGAERDQPAAAERGPGPANLDPGGRGRTGQFGGTERHAAQDHAPALPLPGINHANGRACCPPAAGLRGGQGRALVAGIWHRENLWRAPGIEADSPELPLCDVPSLLLRCTAAPRPHAAICSLLPHSHPPSS